MKNYIEKRGISATDIIYITPRGARIKITSQPYQGRVDSEIITPILGGSPAGAKGKIKIADMPGLADMINSEQARIEQAFAEKYPGIDELLDIIRLHDEAYEDMQAMMEDESRITCKSAPKVSIEEARERYPIAAAYLDIVKLADADPSSEIGYIRCCAGEAALESILQGSDVIDALGQAQAQIEAAKNTDKYRNHVAGL